MTKEEREVPRRDKKRAKGDGKEVGAVPQKRGRNSLLAREKGEPSAADERK